MNEMQEIDKEALTERQRMMQERDEWICANWDEIKGAMGDRISDLASRRVILSRMRPEKGWKKAWGKVRMEGLRRIIDRKGGRK